MNDRLREAERYKKFFRLTNTFINQQQESMEWEPTPARTAAVKHPKPDSSKRATKKQRAKWVSTKEIDCRRERGDCFRCGKSDYLVSRCPFDPAKRPEKATVSKANGKKEKDSSLKRVEADSESSPKDSSSLKLGKE